MKGDPVVKSCANVFTVPHQTTEVIGELGCQVMAIIFGGKCTDSLAALRCKIMSKKVLHSSSFVTPERLPPTESATKFHCRRTYYQIMHGLDGYGRWYGSHVLEMEFKGQ
jgi:hypothetical protein